MKFEYEELKAIKEDLEEKYKILQTEMCKFDHHDKSDNKIDKSVDNNEVS